MRSTAFLDERRHGELASRLCSVHAERTFVVRSPLDDRLIGELPEATASDVRAAAEAARDAQHAWGALDPSFRRLAFGRLATLLQAFEAEAASLVHAETGISLDQASAELGGLARAVALWSRRAPRQLRAVKQRRGLRVVATERREPSGLVGVGSGMQHPFTEPATHATLALLAGNAVLLRPSPGGSFSALLLAELFEAATLPKGLVRVVAGRGDHLDALIAEVVDQVVFDESPELAWHCDQHGVDHLEHAGYVPVADAAILSPTVFTRTVVRSRGG
ncbi:MAG: aldehyde dehydrogenase family protein [Propionicimonas sp.]|uniref:aldehyde dehydrogenase family protein n=1 Tax=Propionicimonas sp. TaxID=1955623 RepID=UPI002B1F6A0F|nr:aldehyde dehydrogenase family protein [Propionicimonas sp.]MEA4945373.1 aldehyde dehydrogenase family protein [Propionicimonas sp.]